MDFPISLFCPIVVFYYLRKKKAADLTKKNFRVQKTKRTLPKTTKTMIKRISTDRKKSNNVDQPAPLIATSLGTEQMNQLSMLINCNRSHANQKPTDRVISNYPTSIPTRLPML